MAGYIVFYDAQQKFENEIEYHVPNIPKRPKGAQVREIQADCDELEAILRRWPQFASFTPHTGRVRAWTGASARRLYALMTQEGS